MGEEERVADHTRAEPVAAPDRGRSTAFRASTALRRPRQVSFDVRRQEQLGVTPCRQGDLVMKQFLVVIATWCLLFVGAVAAPVPRRQPPVIGCTELRTDLPGGRHANVRTMRAV